MTYAPPLTTTLRIDPLWLLAMCVLATCACSGATGGTLDATTPEASVMEVMATQDGCGFHGPFTATAGGRFVSEALGVRAVEAACAFGAQCASGLCSAGGDGACGVCLERRGLGETCDGPLQGCASSAVCEQGRCRTTKKSLGETCRLQPKGGDELECDDELYCARGAGTDTGVCAARAPLGHGCDYDVTCARGLYCLRNVCDVPPVGDCHERECPEGSYCSNSADGVVCASAALPAGARCGIADGQLVAGACGPGLSCGSVDFPNGGGGPATISTCLALPVEGETCMFDRCAAGLFCAGQYDPCSGVINRRCERLRVEGEACESLVRGRDLGVAYTTCASGLECRAGRCAQPCR